MEIRPSEDERRAVQAYVGGCKDGIHWALIRLAQDSVASLSVVPLQDVLGLGSEARLNTPSVSEGNFRWRYQPGSLTRDLAEKLAALAEVTDRLAATRSACRRAKISSRKLIPIVILSGAESFALRMTRRSRRTLLDLIQARAPSVRTDPKHTRVSPQKPRANFQTIA